MPNQHLPLPPADWLEERVQYYFLLDLRDRAAARRIERDLEAIPSMKGQYGIKEKSLRGIRKRLGLLTALQMKQAGRGKEFRGYIHAIRKRFPGQGITTMRKTILQQHHIRVREKELLAYLREIEPMAVSSRKQKRRFKRKRFVAAGVYDLVCFDQHDKWKRFGLYLHLGIDPFPGRFAWLKIWWTNRNNNLVTSYYLEACRSRGGVPLLTQSDPGTENYGIANCHTAIRQLLDPTLVGTLQHRWMRNKQNIKPEIGWSGLRRNWTPDFENILESGVNNGYYNLDNPSPIEVLVFRWVFIPWLQAELDRYTAQFNSTPRRADKNKVLPHGIPDLIDHDPADYGCSDFTVGVPSDVFDTVEAVWANPNDPVFNLTPPAFHVEAVKIYNQLGQPVVDSDTAWDVYCSLCTEFKKLEEDILDTISREYQDAIEEQNVGEALSNHNFAPGQGEIVDVDANLWIIEEEVDDRLNSEARNNEVEKYADFTESELE